MSAATAIRDLEFESLEVSAPGYREEVSDTLE
jgi:hypothetical protein